jgi:hypothetical protein
MIKKHKDKIRNPDKYGFNFAKIDFEPLNPLTELIFKVAVCSLFFHHSQAIAKGISKNNQKNSGFKKLIFSIVIELVLIRQN